MTPEQQDAIKAKVPKIPNLKKMSNIMMDVLNEREASSHLIADCGFCGRCYFSDGCVEGDYEENELEEFRAKAALNPIMYIEWGGLVWTTLINGKEWVAGCECNGPRQVEDFIWSHRNLCAEYLQLRVQRMGEELDDVREMVKKIPIRKIGAVGAIDALEFDIG